MNGFSLSVIENIVKKHSRKLKLRRFSTFFTLQPKKQKLKSVKFEYMPPATKGQTITTRKVWNLQSNLQGLWGCISRSKQTPSDNTI